MDYFCSMWEAVHFSTRLRTFPYSPYNPIEEGRKFSWPWSSSTCGLPAHQMLNRWTIMHGIWLRGTSIGIHTPQLRLSGQQLCIQWQTFPTTISLLLAICFDRVQRLILRMTVVSINDVIHWVCCHLYIRLKCKKLSISSVCSCLNANVILLSNTCYTLSFIYSIIL